MLSTSSAANRLGPECLESKKALTRRRKASLFRSSSGQPDERKDLKLNFLEYP
uniref:Candidate secreted effector n=1 Tax=Meloidogyne incognita TaxID=6306 RepID=A0A914KHM7_MELIC